LVLGVATQKDVTTFLYCNTSIWCSYFLFALNGRILLSAVYFTGEICYTGGSSFEVKTEVDSNDIAKHLYDDQPTVESGG